MATLSQHIAFNGNAEEAFNFYKGVFGSEIQMIMRYKDTPEGIPNPTTQAEGEMVMHISMPVGNGAMLMGCDMPAAFGKASYGNAFNISVGVDSREEADKIYNGLLEGGKVSMPIADTFWGAYFGMVVDKYGVQWMVSYDNINNN
ncbi:MAG: VOC family protein [Flavipsychrobacter sp.]|nr:VOC family protein [Flavipsychrobacter sp.]